MKCHNQKIRKKQDQSVVIPELTREDAETKRDNFFTDAVESVAKICYPYRHNNAKAKKS